MKRGAILTRCQYIAVSAKWWIHWVPAASRPAAKTPDWPLCPM